MKKLFLFMLLAVLSSGCGAFNAMFSKEHCGEELVFQNSRNVSTVHKFGNFAESISIGMTADQVTSAWGKPDRWLSPEKEEWIYSNEKKSNVDQYITYKVIFRNNAVAEIEEIYLKKDYRCRSNDL